MKAVIEGLLYISGEEGLLISQIEMVLSIDTDNIHSIINDMKKDWESAEKGLMIVNIAGGFQLTTKPFLSKYLEKYVEAPKPTSLSQAALETLAIIAYKQPISRAGIEDIRGVKSEKSIQTLVSRDLVKETGRAEGTGRAILYGITQTFLTYFGLTSLDDLPPLSVESFEGTENDESDLFYENFKETLKDL